MSNTLGESGAATRSNLPNAVVVGAGGLGMAIARRMAQGHRIVLADIDGALAERQAAALANEGGEAIAVQCDVTSRASVADLAARVGDLGGFRALVHVAGLSIGAGDFGRIVEVNLRGPALVAQALLPMALAGSCAILIASMAAHLSQPDEAAAGILADPAADELAERLRAHLGAQEGATPAAAYALSKAGLLAMARSQAAAWGKRGARIVSLSPGMIATPMGRGTYGESPNKARMFAKSPLAREGAMHEIADAVEFLASHRAAFISGTDLLVDGGLSAALTVPQG
ncbi:SDR family oxidoreductase [Novosphingobium sp. KA1]|uniref:SDR family oxidoreductase n=1 Tax=Novosphingobium sp. (strain KA1) TaxID=164608 RepID=UPI001A8CB42A|nr:SDR family oxidoreductase [Novosphingobium sp. KA1]QSR19663.1 hypothetical protein CA833_21180 [Novosphingobium sp. KA1]